MIDQTPSPDARDDSTLGDAGLRTIQKLRAECAGYRIRLRELERQRPCLAVAAWRPSTDPRTDGLIGFADLRLGSLLVFDVRLIRRDGAFGLSWPARRPMASERLHEIMRPTDGLDGRALAAVLEHAYPANAIELPA